MKRHPPPALVKPLTRLVSVTSTIRFTAQGIHGTARFVRRHGRRFHTIHASYDPAQGWQQWGAVDHVLADNFPAVEAWLHTLPTDALAKAWSA